MQKESINSLGAKWGMLIGVVYCILLFLRYKTGTNNFVMFGLWTFTGYIIVLILLLIAGFRIRKAIGGYIELKDAVKALFVAVLTFELFYAAFNFIYLKYIDPNFFQSLRNSTEAFLQKSGQSQSKIDETLKTIDVNAGSKMNLFDVLKTYLFWVALSGIIAFFFALIIKRKNDHFNSNQDNFLQA